MSKPLNLKEILQEISKHLDAIQAIEEPFTQEERENVVEIQSRIFNILDSNGSKSV